LATITILSVKIPRFEASSLYVPVLIEMEGHPLWVRAIVVGTIISAKFNYRWQITKQLSKDTKYSDQSINRIKGNSASIKNGRLIYHK
jgi:hypothetical protein